MTARVRARKADMRRSFEAAVEGARAVGWADGSYIVEMVDNIVRVLPMAANTSLDPAAEDARRIREAFGD